MLNMQTWKMRVLRVLAIYRIDLRKPRRPAGIGNSMLALYLAVVIVGILPRLMPVDFRHRDLVVEIIIELAVMLPPTLLVMLLFTDGWRIFELYLLKQLLDSHKLKLTLNLITRLLGVVIVYSAMPLLGLILDYPLPALGLDEAGFGFLYGLIAGIVIAGTLLLPPVIQHWTKRVWLQRRWKEWKARLA